MLGADRPLRGVSVLRDDAGELVRAYGAAGSRAWLIRPDGHLAGSLPLAGRDAVDQPPALQAMAIGAANAPVPASPPRGGAASARCASAAIGCVTQPGYAPKVSTPAVPPRQ